MRCNMCNNILIYNYRPLVIIYLALRGHSMLARTPMVLKGNYNTNLNLKQMLLLSVVWLFHIDIKLNLSNIYLNHSDRQPMKGSTILATLQKLSIMPSFRRPSVSNAVVCFIFFRSYMMLHVQRCGYILRDN